MTEEALKQQAAQQEGQAAAGVDEESLKGQGGPQAHQISCQAADRSGYDGQVHRNTDEAAAAPAPTGDAELSEVVVKG